MEGRKGKLISRQPLWPKLQSLAIPLAAGAFLVATAGTLFRPGYGVAQRLDALAASSEALSASAVTTAERMTMGEKIVHRPHAKKSQTEKAEPPALTRSAPHPESSAALTAPSAAPAQPSASDMSEIAAMRAAETQSAADESRLVSPPGLPAAAESPAAPDEAEKLYNRGQALIRVGDFAAARLLLSRAGDLGHSGALFALASTYDPNILAKVHVRGLVGEPEEAKALYAKALAAGIGDAKDRIAALGGQVAAIGPD